MAREDIVIATPRIELATFADLETLGTLRERQGWRPNSDLLAALLAWDGARTLVIRARGLVTPGDEAVASATALVAGAIGVIGSVVVAERYQRRGLGRVLMQHALAWQRQRGARAVLLDATEAGRPLYSRLGFVSTGVYSWYAYAPLARVERSPLRTWGAGMVPRLETAEALPRLAALDAAAFGGDRIGLLACLMQAQASWLYTVADAAGRLAGYLLARPFGPAPADLRVGPWVAREPAAAAALLDAALDDAAPWRAAVTLPHAAAPMLHATLPGTSGTALALLRAAAIDLIQDDLIMQLDLDTGDTAPAGGARAPVPRAVAPHPEWTYAWLAPMTF